MDGWLRGIGRVLSRHSAIVIGALVAAVGVFAVGAARLDFATGQDSYLSPASTAAIDNERYQALFGGEAMVVLFTAAEGSTIVDVLTPSNLDQLAEIEATLRDDPEVHAVISPITALTWSQDLVTSGVGTQLLAGALARDTDPESVAVRQLDAALTAKRLAAAGTASFDNPDWLHFLLFDNAGFTTNADGAVIPPPDDALVVRKALRAFFPDPQRAMFVGVLAGNASLDQLASGSAAVGDAFAGRTFENADVMVTGTPTFLTEINDYLQEGMLTLGAIALAVMLVVLAVVFRVRWRLLPLLAVLVGIVLGFGLFGFLGGDLSLVTIAGLPILIGIGVEFAVQIHNRIEEECAIDREADPFGETLRRLGPPMIVATVAAVVAFLVMRVSRVPMIQDFGVLLAVGIVMLLVTGVVVPLAILGVRERRAPTRQAAASGFTERLLHGLGSLPRRAVVPLIALAVVVPVVGLVLEEDAKIESDPINWADQSSQTIKNARRLEREVDFASTLGVFVETSGFEKDGIFTDQLSAYVFDLVERELAAEPSLVTASSLVTTVAYLQEVPGATPLAPTGDEILAAYALAPADLQGFLVGQNGNAAQVLFQVGPSSLEARAGMLDRLHASIHDPGGDAKLPSNARVTTGGLAVVGVGLYNNITANRAALTIVALLFVAAWLLIRFRDVTHAVLSMVPVLLAVGSSAILVSVLGITLSPLTTIGGPLVVATCAEFAALLTGRYLEERERGASPSEATALASSRTGRAFIASALTTIGGFAVLVFAALPLLRDFGMIVTLNITVAVLSALVVVPPLAIWTDERGWLRHRVVTADGVRAARYAPAALAAAGVALAFVVTGGFVVADAVSSPEAVAGTTQITVPVSGQPATLPPPTTAAPPSTAGTTTTLPPGATTTTLPPGPAERPDGLVAGAFYDALTGAGVDPGVARCAADELLATTSEADLLAMGVANTPRPAEVDALLAAAATACGVSQATLDQLGG